MGLKFEIDAEAFASLDESVQGMYSEFGESGSGFYRLQVEGIDPADELKEALRKERETNKEAKELARQAKEEAKRIEREKLQQEENWKELARLEGEAKDNTQKELNQLKDQIKQSALMAKASELGNTHANSPVNAKILTRLFKDELSVNEDGEPVAKNYPSIESMVQIMEASGDYNSLWKGNQSSGGRVNGNTNGGAVQNKKLSEMNDLERLQFKERDPEGFRAALRN